MLKKIWEKMTENYELKILTIDNEKCYFCFSWTISKSKILKIYLEYNEKVVYVCWYTHLLQTFQITINNCSLGNS